VTQSVAVPRAGFPPPRRPTVLSHGPLRGAGNFDRACTPRADDNSRHVHARNQTRPRRTCSPQPARHTQLAIASMVHSTPARGRPRNASNARRSTARATTSISITHTAAPQRTSNRTTEWLLSNDVFIQTRPCPSGRARTLTSPRQPHTQLQRDTAAALRDTGATACHRAARLLASRDQQQTLVHDFRQKRGSCITMLATASAARTSQRLCRGCRAVPTPRDKPTTVTATTRIQNVT
jgi:hypothetical protein